MSRLLDLTPLFEPQRILLVGATADTKKWGGWVTKSFADSRARRETYFVNRRGGEIYGIPVHETVADVEAEIDLALIVVPSAGVREAVTQSLALGAKALVIITAGFGEASPEGLAEQEAIVAEARAAGAVVLGPNCLGLYNDATDFNAYGGSFPSGDLGFATQSGNLALEVALLLEHQGLGFSRFASVGNQADLTIADVIRHLGHHDDSKVVGAYVESPKDGADFADAVREAAALKPVVLFAGGRTAAGAHAAASHTGNLAAESRVLRAICRDAGAIVVDTPGQFVDAVAALRTGYVLGQRRIGIVADGGGHGVVGADVVTEHGLVVAELTPETEAALVPHLRHNPPGNPVDLAGADASMLWCFHGLVDAMLAAPEVDAVVMTGYFGGYGAYHPEAEGTELEVVDAIAAAAARHRKPVVVQSMEEPSGNASIRRMYEVGLPVFPRIEQAVTALTRLNRPPAVTTSSAGIVPARSVSARPAYPEAREVLSELGIEFPAGQLASSADEAAVAIEAVGTPAAMKAVAAELLHKTDAGGVVLGVMSAESAAETYSAMTHRVEEAAGLRLDGIWVERMAAADGVDLVVGARRDPSFGPVALIGVGGVFVEVLDDVIIAPVPTDPAHLAGLMRTLRAFPLLDGARGQEPIDRHRVAEIAVRLGDLLLAHPDIDEVEINPLRATAGGATALDARIVKLG